MCGIVGSNFLPQEKVRQLNQLIIHRGPDHEGLYNEKNITLAHKRLSIIDLSEKGNQPMTDKTGNYILVYNGELFNFQSIKEELETSGHTFVSHSDTEVILHAYIQWGEECVSRFNGQFAFCVYDRAKQILFFARDRLGIKPLYYYCKEGKLIFGSELKLILESGVEKELDDYAFSHYLLFNNAPSERSIIKNTAKLLPGHHMTFDLKKNEIREIKKYWQLDFSQEKMSGPELEERIYNLLDESVKRRLIADVPVGAFLSGGVDSSIIVYFMRKYVEDLKTFSIRFDYNDFNESAYAKVVSDLFKTDHHEIEFNAKDVQKYIPKLIYSYDEPFGDESMIPTFLVSEVARQHVTVALSGTGGDELFAGYHRHYEYRMLKKLQKIPGNTLLAALYSLVSKDKAGKLRVLLREKNRAYLYLKLFSHLFRGDNEAQINTDAVFGDLEKLFSYPDDLTNVLHFDQKEYLPNDLLVKEDRATMAVSLEGRVPFLDHTLVEFMNRVEGRWKLKGNTGKYILKKIFEKHLPHDILYRKKKGFGVPLCHYFRKELKEFAYEYLFNTRHLDFDRQGVQKMWDAHQAGHSDYSHFFWIIIMYNAWYEKWMA